MLLLKFFTICQLSDKVVCLEMTPSLQQQLILLYSEYVGEEDF